MKVMKKNVEKNLYPGKCLFVITKAREEVQSKADTVPMTVLRIEILKADMILFSAKAIAKLSKVGMRGKKNRGPFKESKPLLKEYT
jgi:hypothetical protein